MPYAKNPIDTCVYVAAGSDVVHTKCKDDNLPKAAADDTQSSEQFGLPKAATGFRSRSRAPAFKQRMPTKCLCRRRSCRHRCALVRRSQNGRLGLKVLISLLLDESMATLPDVHACLDPSYVARKPVSDAQQAPYMIRACYNTPRTPTTHHGNTKRRARNVAQKLLHMAQERNR